MADDLEELLKSIVGVEDIDEDSRQEINEAELELAEQAAEFWRSIAPVGDANDPHSGQYRDSIQVQQQSGKVYVVTEDPIANLIEYGSAHNEEYACRARTEAQFQGQTEIVAPNKQSKATRSRIEQSRRAAAEIENL